MYYFVKWMASDLNNSFKEKYYYARKLLLKYLMFTKIIFHLNS